MYSGSPAPAPFPGVASPAPAPFPSPHSPAVGQAPSPAPMPMSMPGESATYPSSSEEEESEMEREQDYMASPCPAPAPAPMPMPILAPEAEAEAFDTVASPENNIVSYETETYLQGHQQDVPNPADEVYPAATGTSSNHHDNQHSENLEAAAALIQTLDASYARANAENATTALDADEARSAARTAAEIVRRYTTRSHPRAITSGLSSFGGTSRLPMMAATSASPSAHYFAHPTSAENRSFSNNNNNSNSNNNTPTRPRHYPKTPASAADRIAQSNAEDTLHMSLELERTKQALEAAQMAHDDTKNILAEERSKNSHLQRKLHTIEGTLEHQVFRGRSGEALEAALDQATLRMEAAEEDAQLALDFAKESEENRDQMEVMLEQALSEIQSLRETVYQHEQYRHYHQQYHNNGGGGGGGGEALPPVAEDEASEASSTKQSEEDQDTDEDKTMEEDSSAKSVRFSDPISFSNSPTTTKNDNQTEIVPPEITEQPPPPHDEIITPTKPSRNLVSAGRKLLQLSHSKSKKNSSSPTATTSPFKFDFSPEKAAERRRQLREQMKELDAAVVIRTPSSAERSPFSKQWQQESATKTNKMLEAAKTAMELLQASGKHLELDGHWWKETTVNGTGEEDEEIPLDSLARQYCQSVEVKISRQKGEIGELESLCSFLEENVATDKGIDTAESHESWDATWT